MNLLAVLWTSVIFIGFYRIWTPKEFLKNVTCSVWRCCKKLCKCPMRLISGCEQLIKRRRVFFTFLLAISIVGTVIVLVYTHSTLKSNRNSMKAAESAAEMETRLRFVQAQYRQMREDALKIQENTVKATNDEDNEIEEYDPSYPSRNSTELAALILEILGTRASDGSLLEKPESLKAPFSLKLMPHLLDHPESLRLAYQYRSTRRYADYIIGVPHVKRDRETYLFATLESLVNKMSDEDMNYTMITVMIGETNLTYVLETTKQIVQKFPYAIDKRLIEVISPNVNYYPDMDALPQTLGDSLKRVKWRTKQNLDAIFLMSFAYSRCLYYMMIEDDVIAADNFMTDIRKFTAATTVKNPGWFFIQYSTTGGIGKLFRSTDLIHFVTYVQLFYNNMPIDWLTESYLADRTCGINKGAKECAEAKTKLRPTFKNNLFSHIGVYSSLKGKIQKAKVATSPNVKDSEFYPHKNPPVTHIQCDLKPHGEHTIEAAYTGETYFWGKQPKKGDVIEFRFTESQKFQSYAIRTGNLRHVSDIISNAVFEVLPSTSESTFVVINSFDEFGMVEGQIDNSKFGELSAMRIRFEANSKFWVVITEIEFVPVNE